MQIFHGLNKNDKYDLDNFTTNIQISIVYHQVTGNKLLNFPDFRAPNISYKNSTESTCLQ